MRKEAVAVPPVVGGDSGWDVLMSVRLVRSGRVVDASELQPEGLEVGQRCVGCEGGVTGDRFRPEPLRGRSRVIPLSCCVEPVPHRVPHRVPT